MLDWFCRSRFTNFRLLFCSSLSLEFRLRFPRPNQKFKNIDAKNDEMRDFYFRRRSAHHGGDLNLSA